MTANGEFEVLSRSVSRVLYLAATVIHLLLQSLADSSDLPVSNASNIDGNLFDLAPSGVYHAADYC